MNQNPDHLQRAQRAAEEDAQAQQYAIALALIDIAHSLRRINHHLTHQGTP